MEHLMRGCFQFANRLLVHMLQVWLCWLVECGVVVLLGRLARGGGLGVVGGRCLT